MKTKPMTNTFTRDYSKIYSHLTHFKLLRFVKTAFLFSGIFLSACPLFSMDIFLIDRITGQEAEEMPIPKQLTVGIQTAVGSYYKLSYEQNSLPEQSSSNLTQNIITTGFLNPGKNILFLPTANFFEKTGSFKHNYLLDLRVNEKQIRERITIDIDIKPPGETQAKPEEFTEKKESNNTRIYDLSMYIGNQRLYTLQKPVDFLKLLMNQGKKSKIPGICEPTNPYSIANSPQTSSSVNIIGVISLIGKSINDKKEKDERLKAKLLRELAKEKTGEISGTFWKEDNMGRKVLFRIRIKISNRGVSF